MNKRVIYMFFLGLCFSSCEGQVQTTAEVPFQVVRPDDFAKYWYSGNAELNHYDLEQSRYGETRKGDAVLIYVTEDFLSDKQVKKERGEEKAFSVLKLNFAKKFVTGIYDYSIMTSIFTPVEYMKQPMTLKVTFSSQDWCGQSFSQMNLREKQMNFQVRSYFQDEGDVEVDMPATYIEDDLWTRIRLEPQMLPLGKIDIVPSHEYLRLHHKKIQSYKGEANLVIQVNDTKTGGEFYVYTLRYPELDRVLKIECQSTFPFRITYWEETMNASDPNKKQVTKGKLTDTEQNAYWNLNSNKDESLRDSLGIRYKID